ncbi:MAG TPA: gamma-glutamyltransferase [Pirellulales bacterium]|nr:gamma-glutamyltransferase [Pirellulales bacterium]
MKTCIFLCLIVAAGGSLPRALADEQTVHCRQGVVVSVNGHASDVGLAIQKHGGNAVDSAVATALALAVTYPAAGNIGGGGYLLVMPSQGEPLVFDYREVAPAAATREMFIDPAARTPHRRVGVPGTVRGLALAHLRFGNLPWRDLVRPAIDLARDGFALDSATARSLNEVLATSDKSRFAELHRVFGKPDGAKWRAGDQLKEPELAQTLQCIAERGADGFYLGEVAEKISAEMKRGGGLVTGEDLASYRALARPPLRGMYRGFEILGVPPSSSGGTSLIEALNILECFDFDRDPTSPTNVHRTVEAMKRAYRDRARYLGDPLAAPIPDFLVDKAYARRLAATITGRATPSRELAGDIPLAAESKETTHISVVDKDRMAVSLTYTLENSYGSRVVVPGAGFLLNDEMNDFNWLPGVTDATGRIGTDANLVRPGKRMLSSMCPTIVARDGHPLLVTGSPGGRTIINTVLCVVTNLIDFHMDLRHAVDAPRFHHQWFPDEIRVEPAWSERAPELADKLRAMGHTLAPSAHQGDAHSIWIDPATGDLTGAADRRISGKAAGY